MPKPRFKLRLLGLVLFSAALTAAATGCGEARAQDPIRLTAADLPCASTRGAVFETASFPDVTGASCAWIALPDRATVVIEHPLGAAPALVVPYIAFAEDGRSGTLASGDVARIESVSATEIIIANATNEEFFLRVVAQ